MTIEYLKKANLTAETDQPDLHDTVQKLLLEIEAGGEESVRHYAKKFDSWEGEIVASEESIKAAAAMLPEKLKDDIRFAHDNIRRFAEAQRGTISECDLEIVPGLIAGQRQIPVSAAGCYVPGGRYSHVASAIMTVTTAKVAGVENIVACFPPKPGVGIPPSILFTLDLCDCASDRRPGLNSL
jgi:sulfopropanediol 3-dehydrogenase